MSSDTCKGVTVAKLVRQLQAFNVVGIRKISKYLRFSSSMLKLTRLTVRLIC